MKNSLYSYKKFALLIIAVVILINLASASASTTCKREDCKIIITINIAFLGGDNDTIKDWVDDIEQVWNGPIQETELPPTFGECKCAVQIEVEWTTTTNCTEAMNKGNHCIMITQDYAKDVAGKTYRGYMYGVSKEGSSIKGWWSSHINEELPGIQGPVHDAAHEAGHMLGLEDEYNKTTNTYPNNIMGRTWGNVTPTQEQINQIVEKNCKDKAECPDICCCGNEKIEKDKGEECEKNEDCKEGTNPMCLSCKCYYIHICGDGEISGEEECDPIADPTGCNESSFCNPLTCMCEEIELSVRITEPDDEEEFTINDTITVGLDIDSGFDITEVEFYIDDNLEETIKEEPWEWEFFAGDYGLGEHEIKVTVYDEVGNKDSDSVDIVIV